MGVILYSTTLCAWEVWRNGRPEGSGSLAACRSHAPDAPEPTPAQHQLANKDGR